MYTFETGCWMFTTLRCDWHEYDDDDRVDWFNPDLAHVMTVAPVPMN